jgi:hypothetical protein
MLCIEFRSENIIFLLQISNENFAAKKMTSFCSHYEILFNCCKSYWLNKIRANVIFVNIFDRSISLSLSRSSIIKRIRESQIDWITIENLLFFRFKENCIIFKNLCIRSRIIHSHSLNSFFTIRMKRRRHEMLSIHNWTNNFYDCWRTCCTIAILSFLCTKRRTSSYVRIRSRKEITNFIEFANAIDIESERRSTS